MTKMNFIEIVQAIQGLEPQDMAARWDQPILWRLFRADRIGFLTLADDRIAQAIWDAAMQRIARS